tara:strand:- start:805 stop:1605 length:801 start_codon:yes stop_codon:yes gene_type:complete
MAKADKNLKEFYNSRGWHKKNNDTHYQDSVLWEDNREAAKEYVSKCRLRLAHKINKNDNYSNYSLSLDVGCGPIQYEEYNQYYNRFDENHFLDISQKALDEAKNNARPNSKFICQSAVKFDEKNKYDLILCNHALYHMDRFDQKKVIQNMISGLKSKSKLYITYTNRYSIWNFIFFLPQKIFNLFKSENRKIYFYTHPISWWRQFNKEYNLKIYPLRTISSRESKLLIPNNSIGKKLFSYLYDFEDKYPKLSLYLGTYYIVEIEKE